MIIILRVSTVEIVHSADEMEAVYPTVAGS